MVRGLLSALSSPAFMKREMIIRSQKSEMLWVARRHFSKYISISPLIHNAAQAMTIQTSRMLSTLKMSFR